MFRKRKQQAPRGLAGIEGSHLADSRDAAGFMFGAIMRPETATVVFLVEDAATLAADVVALWEQTVGQNEMVLATEYGVGMSEPTFAVTVLRDEDEDDNELLTRLATTIPEWYMPQLPVNATPLSSLEIAAQVGAVLDSPDEAQWPALNAAVVEEQRDTVVLGDAAVMVFDAMEDAELDRIMHEWCANNYTATSRWVRIFRPAEDMDIATGVVGRRCGILLVKVPTPDVATLRMVVQEIRMMLPTQQRLKLQPLWARQEAGIGAGLGIGAFAWNAEPMAA